MQRDFVAKLWGPTLRNNSLTASLKLMVHDDQRFWLPVHADIMLGDEEAAKYIDGIGLHWYADFMFSASRLSETNDRHPTKFILGTEACNGYFKYFSGPIMGDWYRGEAYAEDIIEDLQNWVTGWTDWNICLDEQGGPNFVRNFVDSPIIVNSKNDEFYKQPMFYVMGHFSKFIRPDSVRIGIEIKTNYPTNPHLAGTAFLTLDQKIVLVLQNRHEWNNYAVHIPSPTNSDEILKFELEHNSIATVVWNNS
jgi:glucosylceramidase